MYLRIFLAVVLAATVATPYSDTPDPHLTPGAVRTTDYNQIVGTRTGTIRNVPQSEKDAVYREYGLDPRHHQPCEVDHLISLELGGSNDITNLWPEHYGEPWGAHDKDKLENRLHAMIVAHQISVPDAQHQIATDWVGAYKRYCH